MTRHVGGMFIILILLVACSSGHAADEAAALEGRLLLWHPFAGKEAEVFNDILDQYSELHPGVTIIREFVPETDMAGQYADQAGSGLGPDILINSYIYNIALVEAGLVQDLSDRNIDTTTFLPTSLSQVRYRDRLYGLPISLYTRVLCYNKTQVSRPPATFQALVDEARTGRRVAVLETFGAAFWGVAPLGGQLLDEQGRVVLDQGGLIEWLNLLIAAKTEANFIFNKNEASILNAFNSGELAYYVCWSNEIPELQRGIGAENLGVAPLPSPTDRPSGPFVLTNAMLFSRNSVNLDLALELAQFLTNPQQQTRLALESEAQIPANNQVTVDERLSPVVAAMVTQSKSAVQIPLDHISQAVVAAVVYGDVAFRLVLEGELAPEEAARDLTERVNREFGLD